MTETPYCPFQVNQDWAGRCDESKCALWVGECAFRALGKAAQQYTCEAEFTENVALFKAAKE